MHDAILRPDSANANHIDDKRSSTGPVAACRTSGSVAGRTSRFSIKSAASLARRPKWNA